MTISKALRFEVLRRDGFACTYCGRKPPEVELHIDHVIPSSLGGSESPENLRTSCVDCNSGKGSTPPGAELVAQVADDAERWAAAIKRAAEESANQISEDFPWFLERWWAYNDQRNKPMPLPPNWKQSIRRWLEVGLPESVIVEMVDVAMGRAYIPNVEVFNYFAGCCWRQVTTMQERASQIIAESESE